MSGLKVIEQFHAEDKRGIFIKTFHQTSLKEYGIDFEMKESFYSLSKLNVIRGMHFQHPPYDHAKIVFCTQGSILDVVMDIRKDSNTYGQVYSLELSASNYTALYIPSGFAHGFKALQPDSLTFYFVSSENHQGADDGILYHSIDFDWEVNSPIVSDRDLGFPSFDQFKSPFL